MRGSMAVLALCLLMVGLFAQTSLSTGPPQIERPMDLYEAAIDGASPETVDPAWAYDIASQELIQNVYDTLMTYDGERVDAFLPCIATSWRLDNITGTTSSEGVAWHYRYVFFIRQGILFQPPYNYSLTAEDVEYSFEREMVQDRDAGPTWMLYEPLLNNGGGAAVLGSGNLTDPENIQLVGKMIDHAVESDSNGTVWFNLAFPGAYAPFMQIICQTWSSILSKQWINDDVIGQLSRPDWSGDWSLSHVGWTLDHTEWIDHHDPSVSPLDGITSPDSPIMYGSGPFIMQTLDFNNQFWTMTRNTAYWRGWPADFPSMADSKPDGYVDTIRCTWAYAWSDRRSMLLSGDIDFCAVPRQYTSEVLGQNGTRCLYPLLSLSADALFFTFEINTTSPYFLPLPSGTFDEYGIPTDFFGNKSWGIHVRKAFAYALDYDTAIAQDYLGAAQQPSTAILPGLPYYDPTVKGYNYNLTRSAEEFQAVPGLWETGFTITLVSLGGSLPRFSYMGLLKTAIESLNLKFHVTIIWTSWANYLGAAVRHQLATFMMGWLADYPEPYNFAHAFYHSEGAFGTWQGYYNPIMNDLIDSAVREPDPSVRATIYDAIQVLAIDDCSNTMTDQTLGRHFERDWVVGWYYNPASSGMYAYNLWKWYYVPQALIDNSTQPTSNFLPADVNYDGKVDIKDVSTAAKSFGASVGPPIDTRWIFRADFNSDKKIDIKDIGYVAKYFGSSSAKWTPHA